MIKWNTMRKRILALVMAAVLVGTGVDMSGVHADAAELQNQKGQMVATGEVTGTESGNDDESVSGNTIKTEKPADLEADGVLAEADAKNAAAVETMDEEVERDTAAYTAGGLTVSGGTSGTDYKYDSTSNTLTIKTSTALTIKNTEVNNATDTKILVEDEISANITLAGVNIDVSGTQGACAFQIADNSTGNVTITLKEGTVNKLTSGFTCAGLQKNGKGEDIGRLTIKGGGTLHATATKGPDTENHDDYNGGGAGIGGGQRKSASNITISGGIIYATGAEEGSYLYYGKIKNGWQSGAGIGGGYSGAGSNITITGGQVIANGSCSGAGIGGGFGDTGSNITISGGCVTAIGDDGAGIGGGYGENGSDIVISGGSVYADGYNAIGGGYEAEEAITAPTNGEETVMLYEIDNTNNEKVVIDGKEYKPKQHGTVAAGTYCDAMKLYAYLPVGAHDIQVGNTTYIPDPSTYMDTELVVTGTDVVYGEDYLYSKGTGVLTVLTDKPMTIANNSNNTDAYTTHTICVAKDVSANLTLAGVNIDVGTSENTTAFLIPTDSKGNVTITLAAGTVNRLESSYYRAGLQKGQSEPEMENIGTLEITGEGTLIAIGGGYGAGIGGESGKDTSGIIISGGSINAIGGAGENGSGAGIGGGDYGDGNHITITGGSVLAKPGEGASAIGGGFNGNGDATIMNGTRKAYPYTIKNPDQTTIKVDGKEYKPSVHVTDRTTYNEIYVYLTGEENHTIQVGDGRMTAIRYDETVKDFVEIPAPDMFTVTLPEDLIYDKTAKSASVVSSREGVGDITVKYYKDGQLLTSAPVLPGMYTIKIDVTATDSYGAVNDLTHEDWNYTIEKALLSVTGATAVEKTYDGTNKVTISEVTLSGIVTGDDVKVDVTNLTGSLSSAEAGTYTTVTLPSLTLTGRDAACYELVQPDKAVATMVNISSLPADTPPANTPPADNPPSDNREPVVKGRSYKDDSGKAIYKVTKAHAKSGTVEYKSPVNKKATKVIIPATVKIDGISYKVTGISANAFKNNKKLKTITIGKNVKTIGDKAFYKCTALTRITIPGKVNKIGKQAFYGCKKLKSITIKTRKLTTKRVGKNAFKGIYKKAKIKVPKTKLKAYKSLLVKRGVSRKATIKK